MKRENTLLGMLALLPFLTSSSSGHSLEFTSSVSRCQDMVSTHSGMGPAYRRLVKNEDYGFSAYVPKALTGWGGVEQSAPFHGFTIFLDQRERSCIVFEIHIRVDEDDTSEAPAGATSVSLGKAHGWQFTKSGQVHGLRLINIVTKFTFRQHGEIDDGEIVLVAPEKYSVSAIATYQSFLHSITFGDQ